LIITYRGTNVLLAENVMSWAPRYKIQRWNEELVIRESYYKNTRKLYRSWANNSFLR